MSYVGHRTWQTVAPPQTQFNAGASAVRALGPVCPVEEEQMGSDLKERQ